MFYVMRSLLHLVDNTVDSNAASEMLIQSFLHSFGLRLAPPSQRQLISDHLWCNVHSKQRGHSARAEHQGNKLPLVPTTLSLAHTSSQQTTERIVCRT
jgi:hypothetical protein